MPDPVGAERYGRGLHGRSGQRGLGGCQRFAAGRWRVDAFFLRLPPTTGDDDAGWYHVLLAELRLPSGERKRSRNHLIVVLFHVDQQPIIRPLPATVLPASASQSDPHGRNPAQEGEFFPQSAQNFRPPGEPPESDERPRAVLPSRPESRRLHSGPRTVPTRIRHGFGHIRLRHGCLYLGKRQPSVQQWIWKRFHLVHVQRRQQ